MKNRLVKLNKIEIKYNLKISSRAKRIRLQISGRSGLEVILPKGTPENEAEKLIFRKQEWILKYLNQSIKRFGQFHFFGSPMNESHPSYSQYSELRGKVLKHKPDSPDELIQRKWLLGEAGHYIPARTAELAGNYGFSYNAISIRNQKTRWGSCSGKKRLSFNFNLMSFQPEVIDYVIIHELCHLKHMNHSQAFWNEVAAILPDFKILRKKLKAGFNE